MEKSIFTHQGICDVTDNGVVRFWNCVLIQPIAHIPAGSHVAQICIDYDTSTLTILTSDHHHVATAKLKLTLA
jgi:hypothetical protein